MGRSIAGVIVGFLVMQIAIFTTFTVAYLMLGADRSFVPGGWEPSATWLVLSVVLGLVGSILGGLVCAIIAKGGKATLVLAVITLVLGLGMSTMALMAPDNPDRPEVRGPDVDNFEAMMNAEAPTWSVLLNPVLGFVGIMIGGSLVGKGKASPAA